MSDARFGSWSAAESPVTIEYSLVVIEEIRHEVAEGFQKLSCGGVEVGGVLYGARDGRTIRILAMRPIACEHERGPAFLLSDSDRQALEEQLEHGLEDPRLAEMICLGWFCSHTRSEIVLTESDLEVYGKYFGAPWQVTLVIRPGRGGSMRAGFFVREHDGAVRGESSYLEFNFPDRLAGVLDRSPRAERPATGRGHPVYFRDSGAAPARREQPQPPDAALAGPQLLPAPPPRAKWPWLAAWGVVVLVAIVLALRYFVLTPRVEPLGLSVIERDGQLQIEWNRAARPVTNAVRGSLIVTDGQNPPRTIPLTQQDLEHGALTYQRTSNDVAVRMNVENAGGVRAEDVTTFLAAAPGKAAADENTKAIEQERDELKAEVERLKNENADQADRIQQLERNLKVLQSRLGIQ
jgi:hypothetical protein